MSTDLRVLHVAETLKGGIETYLASVAKYQLSSPAITNVWFLLPGTSDHIPHDATVLHAGKRSLGGLLKFLMRGLQVVRELRPDVLHLHSSMAGGLRLFQLLGLFPRNCRVVYCAHGWAFDQKVSSWKRCAYAVIERLLSLRTGVVICISDHDRTTGKAAGVRRCVTVLNGVEVPATPPAATVPSMSGRRKKILFVGRLDRQKGVDLLLDSYARVKPAFELVVAGASVRGGFVPPPCAGVEYRGWMHPDQLAALYLEVDAVIVPSRWEGFGLVAVEAMAHGKPVFASNVGGLSEIVLAPDTGMLFDIRQLDDVLGQIDLLNLDQLAAMGEHARNRFLRHFTSERMNREILGCYSRALGLTA